MTANICSEKNKRSLALNLSGFLLTYPQKPVFLCVGSDKVIGDLIGVIVGELLTSKFHIPAYVYGTASHNITAKNLNTTIKYIKANHPTSPIVVVDGILGEMDEVGQVKYYPYGSIPAGEYNKGTLTGNYSILGVVNTKGVDALTFLKSVKLKTVVTLANFIADSINLAYTYSLNLLGK